MSEIIRSNVDVSRIEEHVRRAYRMAVAREGVVAATALERLAPAVADIDAALAVSRPASEAEAVAWAAVLSEDEKSDVKIGAVRDAMWAALGRPSQNRYLSQVFPGGITTYTKGDPRRQPVLMTLLESRILSCAAPQWSDDQRKAWTAEIATARKAYEDALDKHRPSEAAAFIAAASYRSAVKMGHEALRAFKRDLQNLGLSRAQIFDIIPDGTPAPAPAPKADGAKADGASGQGDSNGSVSTAAATNVTAAPKAA